MSALFDYAMQVTREYVALPILMQFDANEEPHVYQLTLALLIVGSVITLSVLTTIAASLMAEEGSSKVGASAASGSSGP